MDLLCDAILLSFSLQYQLIRGILDHNLGEQFAPFAVPESGYLVDPVQVVGPEDRVYKNISIAIDLTNVTGKQTVTNTSPQT